ncbi:MAG: flavin reductase family protein [Planctomycetota bacterium]|nr:flavin reductase family protein [Planctomycetota bacterium]
MANLTLDPQIIHNALRSLPTVTFVLTCQHEQFRDGIITTWVQQCSSDPPLLVVAITKGQPIEPLLRDARAFALCMVPNNDKRVQRLFGRSHNTEDDPFLSLQIDRAETGMPILKDAIAWFDCKLAGHLSPDAECRLYLGEVVAAHFQTTRKKKFTSKSHITPPMNEKRKRQRSATKKTHTRSKS